LREDARAVASAAFVLGGAPFAERWFIWRSVEDMAADCLTLTSSRILKGPAESKQ
jgi:hypothetical protein